MGFKNDLTGKVFGRLTVIEFSHNGSNWSVHWKCRCSCGAYIVVRNNNLLSGNTKSCGCQKIRFIESNVYGAQSAQASPI